MLLIIISRNIVYLLNINQFKNLGPIKSVFFIQFQTAYNNFLRRLLKMWDLIKNEFLLLLLKKSILKQRVIKIIPLLHNHFALSFIFLFIINFLIIFFCKFLFIFNIIFF